jgi:hypothetical protein
MSNREDRATDIAHGTSTAYVKRRCRCPDCRAWQSDRLARQRSKRPLTANAATKNPESPAPARQSRRGESPGGRRAIPHVDGAAGLASLMNGLAQAFATMSETRASDRPAQLSARRIAPNRRPRTRSPVGKGDGYPDTLSGGAVLYVVATQHSGPCHHDLVLPVDVMPPAEALCPRCGPVEVVGGSQLATAPPSALPARLVRLEGDRGH